VGLSLYMFELELNFCKVKNADGIGPMIRTAPGNMHHGSMGRTVNEFRFDRVSFRRNETVNETNFYFVY
jgi:hypothetical protein